jgi:hypothetical protein
MTYLAESQKFDHNITKTSQKKVKTITEGTKELRKIQLTRNIAERMLQDKNKLTD